MTEQTLIQWVRGQLPPGERRQVTEWMIRCQDPALPLLLDGIMQAERDAERDRLLMDLGPVWAQLVSGWQGLLDQGRAVLMDAPAGDFVMASTQGAAPVLQLVRTDQGDLATLIAPFTGHFRLIYSSDAGQVELLGQASLGAQEQLQVALKGLDQRSTVWALSGPSLPQGSLLDQLAEALSTDEATRVLAAARLDPRPA